MHITIVFLWSFVCLFEQAHFLSSRAVISRQMCPADYYRNITKKERSTFRFPHVLLMLKTVFFSSSSLCVSYFCVSSSFISASSASSSSVLLLVFWPFSPSSLLSLDYSLSWIYSWVFGSFFIMNIFVGFLLCFTANISFVLSYEVSVIWFWWILLLCKYRLEMAEQTIPEFVQRIPKNVWEKQQYYQSAAKFTHMKGPHDKYVSFIIPSVLVATAGVLMVRT